MKFSITLKDLDIPKDTKGLITFGLITFGLITFGFIILQLSYVDGECVTLPTTTRMEGSVVAKQIVLFTKRYSPCTGLGHLKSG